MLFVSCLHHHPTRLNLVLQSNEIANENSGVSLDSLIEVSESDSKFILSSPSGSESEHCGQRSDSSQVYHLLQCRNQTRTQDQTVAAVSHPLKPNRHWIWDEMHHIEYSS
ncbi:hypothetical protein LENED_009450 [Lentinula edodes]|uniref:Uncharacterized protein n=1 Tax=Lentinula edodes TaxID=5353 RepID=A0A1Q3EJT0_LENED|nr:hypothetical protein LENED_009450 [Lentinula edodes]